MNMLSLCLMDSSIALPYHQIAMRDIFQYRPEGAIPQITLKIKWIKHEQPTEYEKLIPVKVTGVTPPKSFILECSPNTISGG